MEFKVYVSTQLDADGRSSTKIAIEPQHLTYDCCAKHIIKICSSVYAFAYFDVCHFFI